MKLLDLYLDVAANTPTPEALELQAIMAKLKVRSVNEFAEMLGVAGTTYRNYHYSVTKKVPLEVMTTARSLVSSPAPPTNDGHRVSLIFGPMARVPIVGTVSAGPGVTNVDSESDSVYVPMSLQQIGGIGYVIDGDSMMPALQPGDVALFRETYQPRNGFTFLIKKDGEHRCKNIIWQSGEWVMQSLNNRYAVEPLHDWQILGMLVGWYRSIGSYEKLEADPNGLRLDSPV